MTVSWLGVTLHEFDVAATDFLLFVEALVLSVMLTRQRTPRPLLKTLAIALFVLLGASSLLGAAFHAFFPAKTASTGGYIVWMATGLSIAMTASVVWSLNAQLMQPGALTRVVNRLVPVYFATFATVLFFVSHAFATIISLYATAVVVLAGIACRNWMATRAREWRNLSISTALSFAAAGVQVGKIDLHPAWFNFNALYHLVQGVALVFLFLALRQMLPQGPSR